MSGGVVQCFTNGVNQSPPETQFVVSAQYLQHGKPTIEDMERIWRLVASDPLNSLSIVSPYKEKTEHSQMNYMHIQQNCHHKYFQMMDVEYHRHDYSVSSIIPEDQFQQFKEHAFQKTLEHFKVLLQKSTSPELQTDVERIRATEKINESLQLIGSSLVQRNLEKRMKSITTFQNKVLKQFQDKLKFCFEALYEEEGNPSLKFYDDQELNEGVKVAIKEEEDNCDVFVKSMAHLFHSHAIFKSQVKDVFDSVKQSVNQYGLKLISKNQRNSNAIHRKLTAIVGQFESNCTAVIQMTPRLPKETIAEIVKEEKRKLGQQIVETCNEYAVNSQQLRLKFEAKLEENEKLVLQSAIKFAKADANGILEKFIGTTQISFDTYLKKVVKEMPVSRVQEDQVQIVTDNLNEAMRKSKLELFRSIPDYLGEHLRQDNHNGEAEEPVENQMGKRSTPPTHPSTLTAHVNVSRQPMTLMSPQMQVAGNSGNNDDQRISGKHNLPMNTVNYSQNRDGDGSAWRDPKRGKR